MGRLLTALGVLLVLVFVGAASAPFLIDWNKHKPLFEAEAARVLGVPVLVDGRMDLELLPSPVLRVDNVRIGRPGAEARVASVHFELSVGGLVRGHVDVVQARLVEPKVWLGLDRDGRLSGIAPAVDLSTVSIRRVEVEGGELSVEDPREGTRFFASQLAFAGEASSLAGPWRLEGAGRFEGQQTAFNLQTGRADEQGLRFRLVVEPAERPIATDFDGRLTSDERRPVIAGFLRLRGVGAGDASARDGGWRAEAQVEIRPERLVATSIRLVPANANERVLELTGSVNVALGARARVDAALALRQLDIDRLAGVAAAQTSDGPTDVVGIVRRAATLPALLAVPGSDGRLSLDVGSVVLAGGLLQDVRIQTDVVDGRLRLSHAEAKLPGQGTFRASGQMGLRGGPLLFDGPVELAVRAPGTFVSWLEGDLLRPRETRSVPPPPGGISIAGRATVGPDRIGVRNLSAVVGGAALTGEVEALFEPAPVRLRARLGTADLDIEPLAALVAALLPRFSGVEFGDVDATLRADRLRFRSLDARGVDLALRNGADGLAVDSLSAVLNGVAVSGVGRIEPDGRGAVRVRLAADRIAPALAALRDALGAHPVIDALDVRATALGAVALDTTVTRQADALDIAVTGTAGAVRIEAGATLDRPGFVPEAVRRLTGSLQAARAEPLLALLGFDVVPAPQPRASRLTVTLERQEPGDRHRFSLDADLAGTRTAAVGPLRLGPAGGALDGIAVALSSADVTPLALALGRPLVDVADRVPVSIRGQLDVTPGAVRISGIDGSVGGESVKGEVGLTREVVPKLSGHLSVGSLVLERVAALVTGPWPQAENTVWASGAFGPRPLPPMAGTIAVETPKLDLDVATLQEVRFTLRVGEGGLGLEGLTGRLAGGRFLGELVLSRPEAGVRVIGRVTLENARLEEVVWRVDGRPAASARVDLRVNFEATGRSPAVLVSGLTGEGSIQLSRGEIRGLATTGFTAGLRASEAGIDLDETRLLELVRREMSAGSLPFERLDAAFTLQGGVLRATNLALDRAPVQATGRASVDLTRWTLDADWTLEGEPLRAGLRGPRIGLAFAGPLAAPERRIDVRAFVDLLNLRRFEREVERLEAIQRQIDERERILREMEQQEELRRERALRDLERRTRENQPQTPAATAPTPPAAPAAPAAPAPAAPPDQRANVPPTADERARFNAIIQDSLRAAPPVPSAAPEAAPAPQRLDPLPPPVVVPTAPGGGRTGFAPGAPVQLVPR